MGRLNEATIDSIVYRIKKGESLNSISKTLNLGKSTLYYYYKKIKGKRYKEPKYSIRFSEKEGEILGIFVGDGSQHYAKSNWNYQTNVHFGNCPDYANYVKNLYETYFNKKWRLGKEIDPKSIRYRLRVSDKKIFNYFSNFIHYDKHRKHDTVSLKALKLPLRYKIGFLRGLLDTDGTVCQERATNRIKIVYYTTSNALAKQILKILREMRIACGISKVVRKGWKDLYNVYVLQHDVDKFLKLIKPFKARKFGPVV
ncbi:MAG TPA: LAGLIDADG family homing endonuclease [Candidatus Nanoarchaeia archaeon]|nr:LAGLIDADG family homing endonuclease [Candidatus Nanoarchaeia archaeon]